MSEGDAAQDEQTAGNAIVAVSSIFAPGEVVTLRRREEGEMRPGAGEVVGRRTVDENGLVGFVGFEQDELFWACGYSAGSPMNVRCVAKDPAEAIVFFQPAVQPSPLSTGTTGTRPVAVPPAEPDTPTDGTGIPAGAVEAAEGAQSGTPTPPDLVTAGAEDAPVVDPPAPDSSQAATDPAAPGADPSPVIVAGGGALAPVDDSNPPAPDAGTPDSSESSGTGQANGGAIEQAPDVGQPPAPDGTTTADGSPVADAAPALTAPDGTAVDEPEATPPADVAAPAVVTDQSSADVPGAPAEATVEPLPTDDTPSDAPIADAAQSSDAPAPAAAADSSSSAAAPAVDQPAAVVADADPVGETATWQQLLDQANGLGVENAATLSDAELRQAITEKGAAPVA